MLDPPPWLVEIHEKLWGKSDLFGELFRTVTLTKSDFFELQTLLDGQNIERRLDSYVADNVLATKSAFLRSRSNPLTIADLDGGGLVARLVFNAQSPSADDVGDPMVVDSKPVASPDSNSDADHLSKLEEAVTIFPCTIRYIDLTVLKLERTIRVPQLILFRNEWNHMVGSFNERKSGESAIFTGQPGIGKRCRYYLTYTNPN